jgi:adenosine deaminase
MEPLHPLQEIEIDDELRSLPKVDLHVHAESEPRLDRMLARRGQRPGYDWHRWVDRLMREVPPGIERLGWMNGEFDISGLEELDAQPEYFIARIQEILEEAAADGAVLVEVRFGALTVLYPHFMVLFREAEQRAQARFPGLCAEAILSLRFSRHSDDLIEACLKAAKDGLAGVDLLPEPYEEEAEWAKPYQLAMRLSEAGLGITAHAGEFAAANIQAAMMTPGLTRIGHGTYAMEDPDLVRELADRDVLVETCLTCNVVLGSASSYEGHPARSLFEAGVDVCFNTDDPVRVCTSIGREYAIAQRLGFSAQELAGISRRAIAASFTSAQRKTALLQMVADWEDTNLRGTTSTDHSFSGSR